MPFRNSEEALVALITWVRGAPDREGTYRRVSMEYQESGVLVRLLEHSRKRRGTEGNVVGEGTGNFSGAVALALEQYPHRRNSNLQWESLWARVAVDSLERDLEAVPPAQRDEAWGDAEEEIKKLRGVAQPG